MQKPESQKMLRIESPLNNSGILYAKGRISILKKQDYEVLPDLLDGDAPKQFIKAYIYEQDGHVRKHKKETWHKFIAKTAEKWYPHESVIEFMLNKIGEVMGVEMNQSYLVIANGQIRFLSQYFLNKDERLTHGAEICGEHLKDHDFAKEVAENKKTARELFTFEFIEEAIRCVYPRCYEEIMQGFVSMLVFDAIIGSNDRHFYNWGVIENKKNAEGRVRFSPIYDTARGLYWNMSDENIKQTLHIDKTGGRRIFNYTREAAPRVGVEGNPTANHFDLLAFILRQRGQYRDIVLQYSTVELEEAVFRYLRNTFFPFFSAERCEIILKVLENRFKQIRELLI